MTKQKLGFTVCELLLAVAIVAMLAALLLPVFVAQREVARGKSCLANQQKIVSAIRMYLADHDSTFPPREHRPDVIAYFDAAPGGEGDPRNDETGHCRMATQANPYLRWPVIFDPYVPGRSVWQCPNAVLSGGATWIVPGPDWLGHLIAWEGAWGPYDWEGGGPCYWAWPPGWGGTVTDSVAQQKLAGPADGAFTQSIAASYWPETRLSEVADPGRFVILGDGGAQTQGLGIGTAAYPDLCALECGNACGWVDWEVCAPWASDCGLYHYAPNDGSFLRNPSLRMRYARHRALAVSGVPPWYRSGVNIGFLDGHAQWVQSETLIARIRDDIYAGVKPWGMTTEDPGYHDFQQCFGPDTPTIY